MARVPPNFTYIVGVQSTKSDAENGIIILSQGSFSLAHCSIVFSKMK